MRKRLFLVAGSLVLAVTIPGSSEAHVLRLVVEQTRPIADGKRFGDVGPYERLGGTVYIEIDPRDQFECRDRQSRQSGETAKGSSAEATTL
jgi:hypothetical protein